MSNWCSIIPLHRLQIQLDQPVPFAGSLTLAPFPDWVNRDSLTRQLGSLERDALNQTTHAFIAEYEANSLGDPDPAWKGDKPISIQESKYELAVLANFALWLARPSPVCFTLVFHAPCFEEEWAVQQWKSCSPLLCHPGDLEAKLAENDIARASSLHEALSVIPRGNAIWTSVRSSWAALQMNIKEVRYLLFWIALEALFGPEDGREMTIRLAQRIALFLGSGETEAREIFKIAKDGYSLRSQVAHGRWKDSPKSIKLMASTECLARQSLSRIVSDTELRTRFLGNGRESYLDGLVFSVLGKVVSGVST